MGTNPTPLEFRKEKLRLANIEEKVGSLLQEKIEKLGYELYDVEYGKEGADYFLRIYIDKPEGIDIEDCEKVSQEINPVLDEVDYIQETYFLEVSSPGIERNIRKEKHLEASIGQKIEVHLFKPIEGKKIWVGILQEWNKEDVCLLEEEKTIKLPRADISKMKTVYDW